MPVFIPKNIITIGGNIGCGKSILMDSLKKHVKTINHFNVEYFPEPIEKWGHWIDSFYMNPTKYGFHFQMKILAEFLYFDMNKHIFTMNVTERSPLESLEVFSRSLVHFKNLAHTEHNLFCEYFNLVGWKPQTFIYLKTDPSVCHDRIKQRQRECESGITLEYIQNIHEMYEQFLFKYKDIMNIHVIDANQSEDKVFNTVQEILKNINNIHEFK